MTNPITLDDVAAKAGVSRWTVAAAMRGRGRVNPDTAKRLKQLAAEMGYDPALTQAGRHLAEARHGRQSRNHLVAIVLPAEDVDLPFYAQLLRGAVLGLAEGGYASVLSDVWRAMFNDLGNEARYGAALLRGQIDAAIVHPTHQEAVDRLLVNWRQGCFGERPVVTLLRSLPGMPCAGVDAHRATISALRLLLSLGHRRIAFLYWDCDDVAVAERSKLAADCLATAGLDPHSSTVPPRLPMTWMQPRTAPHRLDESGPINRKVESQLIAWLRANPDVTTLFAPNDSSALHVFAALRRGGLRVPEDISLIGSDGTDDLADGGPTRFLATIKPDLAEVGRSAARIALAMIDGTASASSNTVAEFLPGRSVGSCRK